MHRETAHGEYAAGAHWVLALKIVGLTLLLVGLLSIDYVGMSVSMVPLQTPVQLVLVAFFDTLLLAYVVMHSRWRGWKEWGVVFCVFYGFVYLLTAMESVYLGSIFTMTMASEILVNGAIVSGVFSAALVRVLGNREGIDETRGQRLFMPRREWTWKLVSAAAVYLIVFIVFGLAVYRPIAQALDPLALAAEQSTTASFAVLVFPVELFRGALWALLAVPAIVALRFGWRKTALVTSLLLAVPLSGALMLGNSMSFGLQVAHFAEIFVENLVFGSLVVWILHLRSRVPSTGV